VFFYILYVYFVSPYFYHDAFMHHAMHVLDAPVWHYSKYRKTCLEWFFLLPLLHLSWNPTLTFRSPKNTLLINCCLHCMWQINNVITCFWILILVFVFFLLAQPCRNGATCIPSETSFQCVCRIGYSGTLCDVLLSACTSNPCLNGAVCFDGSSTTFFSCACPPGERLLNCLKFSQLCVAI